MQSPVIAVLLTILGTSGTFGQVFNLSSAECFNPKAVAAINLFMEWSAFNEDASDGYCYDNHGSGYEGGQNFISCGGCMKFNCTSRPCDDRDGSKFKMFWVLESVATQCCQDCEGKIFPPNRVVSTTSLGDKCDTLEQAICKTSSDLAGTVGTIEVSYTSGNCCLDENTWSPAGTTILEKDTCSARTCMQGRPAQWDRQTKYQGGCGCCEYQSALLLPGDCQTLLDGRQACCCDGEMVVTVDQTVELQSTPPMAKGIRTRI
eukprot:GFUD01013667.1.p1 GENE.GFUD01013667.1~~GFUD01013667.1.p1  ORF type:complete len:261 (-),score=85.66 GFUD01013667.1:165-947(-)